MSRQKIISDLPGGEGDSEAPPPDAGLPGGPVPLPVPILPPVAHGGVGPQETWEALHKARPWGSYPSEWVIRFVLRNYGALPEQHRKRVIFLDLGCGNGASTWFLAREGFTTRAVDISETALYRLRDRLFRESLHPRVAYQLGDATRMVFSPGGYECVLDICCLQHTMEPGDTRRAVENAHRALKAGGRMLMVHASGEGDCSQLEPSPRPLGRTQIEALFAGWSSVEIGHELQERPNGLRVAHWVVEAQK